MKGQYTSFSLKGLGSIVFQMQVGIGILLKAMESAPEVADQIERLQELNSIFNDIRVMLVQKGSDISLTEDEIEKTFVDTNMKIKVIRSSKLKNVLDVIQEMVISDTNVQKVVTDLREFQI